MYREILAQCAEKLGAEHIDTMRLKVNLGTAVKQRGELLEAKRLFAEALPVFEKELGRESTDNVTLMNNLAEVHKAMKAPHLAEPLLRDCLELSRKSLGVSAMGGFGGSRLQRGQRMAAAP